MRLYMPLVVLVSWVQLVGAAELPAENPVAAYKLAWTEQIRWGRVVSIGDFVGSSQEERLEKAQAALAGERGGVVFFPAGEYRFSQDIRLRDGVVLRGADPQGVTDAREEGYALGTRFEFPKFEPKLEGDGTPKESAFKGIELAEPATASNCGVVNIAINRGHVRMAEGEGHVCGKNRVVFGCVLRNAAMIDEKVPDVSVGQKAWQRYTKPHQAAIHVFTAENALVANCRLPESSDSFNMPGYVILGRGRNAGPVEVKDGVMFDYDNRAGIVVNPFSLGGGGGQDPKGDPETMPWGFRKGIVIRDNYIYSTGRTAIHFTGDGTVASFNVIRFKPNVMRQTNTGIHMTSGSSTNDNRAMTIRGWRYTVEGNDYEVYRNRCADGVYYINDGEGLMHEGHANCTIKDSRIINNKGNAYLSIYLTAGIDGLAVEGNDIRPQGPGTDTKISSIFVVADRNADRHYCRNVKIINNTTSGSGISIIGAPAENNVVEGNRHVGGKEGVIINGAEAAVRNNEGYRVEVPKISKPLADPNRPTAKAGTQAGGPEVREGVSRPLVLAPGEGNPRNSEGDFIVLKDGRVLFIYTRFTGGTGDHAAASLAGRSSGDGGRSWSERDDMVVARPEGVMNIMSVSLLRLADGRIALFYLVKKSTRDCRAVMRISTDEGKSWGEPILCMPEEGYFVVNNGRAVQLRSGRIVLPAARHDWEKDKPGSHRGVAVCFFSDDGGKTWNRSRSALEAPAKSRSGLQEPLVVELKDGRLMMLCRTDLGCQYRSYSDDRGDRWSEASATDLLSPLSPASIKRIPESGDLLLVWNDHTGIDPALRGKRTPLTVAISKDEGGTWVNRKTLYEDPAGWYCYTAIVFAGERVLLGHCAGQQVTGSSGLATTFITCFDRGFLYR